MKHIKKQATTITKSWLQSGGALLALGAIVSKIFGLLRDRIFLSYFPEEKTTDLLFAAFRIPDFFFFLLISGTVATILIPRLSSQKESDHKAFVSSMSWFVFVGFGSLCFVAAALAPLLTEIIAPGLSPADKMQITALARVLFGSVFLLSLSSVFGAALQYYKIFWPLAVTPLIYTSGIITGTLLWHETSHILAVGYGALLGAIAHLVIQSSVYMVQKGPLIFTWKKPQHAWKGAKKDFSLRALNASTFQIAQSIDVNIASFLLDGSLTAFTFGSALGHILLTIIGLSTARSIFPHLSNPKNTPLKQKQILNRSQQFIWLVTLPASVFLFLFAQPIIVFLYPTTDHVISWTTSIFQWTVASLPFACLIPLYSRVFLANNDTKTPLVLTTISFSISISIAAFLALIVLPESNAVIGLGIGNFLTNISLCGLLWFKMNRQYFSQKEMS